MKGAFLMFSDWEGVGQSVTEKMHMAYMYGGAHEYLNSRARIRTALGIMECMDISKWLTVKANGLMVNCKYMAF